MKKESNPGRGTAKKPSPPPAPPPPVYGDLKTKQISENYQPKMILFEATNGMCGYSYERCYIWAISEERARELILRNYGAIKYSLASPPPNLVACWRLRPILYSDDGEFITKISTDGWER